MKSRVASFAPSVLCLVACAAAKQCPHAGHPNRPARGSAGGDPGAIGAIASNPGSPADTTRATRDASSGAPSAPAASNRNALSIVAFDCRPEDAEEGSLRSWDSGGPNGAAWNMSSALVCTIELESLCAGQGLVELRVGDTHHPTERVALAAGTSRRVDFVVAPAVWEAELRADDALIYETLFLAMTAYVVCLEENAAHHASKSFVSGFAWGE